MAKQEDNIVGRTGLTTYAGTVGGFIGGSLALHKSS
jgi:hypothetical protein